jgi:hypothetical protein
MACVRMDGRDPAVMGMPSTDVSYMGRETAASSKFHTAVEPKYYIEANNHLAMRNELLLYI